MIPLFKPPTPKRAAPRCKRNHLALLACLFAVSLFSMLYHVIAIAPGHGQLGPLRWLPFTIRKTVDLASLSLIRRASDLITPIVDVINFTAVMGLPRIVIKSAARHYNVWEDGESSRAWSLVEEGRYKPAVVECIFAARQSFAIAHQDSGGWFVEIGSQYGAMSLAVADHFEGVVAVEAKAENIMRLAANIAWNSNIALTTGIVAGEVMESGVLIRTNGARDQLSNLTSILGPAIASSLSCMYIDVDEQTFEVLSGVEHQLILRGVTLPVIVVSLSHPSVSSSGPGSIRHNVLTRLMQYYSYIYCNDVGGQLMANVLSDICALVVFSSAPLDFESARTTLVWDSDQTMSSYEDIKYRILNKPVLFPVPFPPTADCSFLEALEARSTRHMAVGRSWAAKNVQRVFIDRYEDVLQSKQLAWKGSDIIVPRGPQATWSQLHLNNQEYKDLNVYDDSPSGNWWWNVVDRTWEPETFYVLREILSNHPGVYVDVGMWIGPTVLYAAQYAPVIAFEADPIALYVGAANIAANPNIDGNTTIVPRCINAIAGIMQMQGSGGSVSKLVEAGEPESYAVQCTTLPAAIEALAVDPKSISLIKLDIEGAEQTVLPSLRGWLVDNGLPALWLSLHVGAWKADGVSPAIDHVQQLLEDYAYAYDSNIQPLRSVRDLVRHVNNTAILLSLWPVTPLRTDDADQPSYAQGSEQTLVTYSGTNVSALVWTPGVDTGLTSWQYVASPCQAYFWTTLESVLASSSAPVVLDVGAGFGAVSVFAAALHKTVYAFEPDVYFSTELLRNAVSAGLQGSIRWSSHCVWRWEVHHEMTGSSITGSGSLTTFARGDFNHRGSYDNHTVWPVICSSLPAFMHNASVPWGDIAAIVIDVNGAESEIMLSIRQLGTRVTHIPLFLKLYRSRWPLHKRHNIAHNLRSTILQYQHVYSSNGEEITDRVASDRFFDDYENIILLGSANSPPEPTIM